MNKFICAIFGVLVSVGAHAVPAVVDYVIDGDTFAAAVSLDDDISITVRVRIMNVDTPEMNGKCASEIDGAHRAHNRLSEILSENATVDLRNIKDDKYLGRIDANVILPDGRDVGEILVHEGLARLYSGGKRQSWCN